MISSPPPSLAGSKRCAAGNVINGCHHVHQIYPDDHYQLHHDCIDPQVLCQSCHPRQSTDIKLESQYSNSKTLKREVNQGASSYRSQDSSDSSIDLSEAHFQAWCEECLVEQPRCTEQCSPCPGDNACPDTCSADDAECCAEECEIVACDKEECCTKISCPGKLCVCAQCCTTPCSQQDNWDSCHVGYHPSSFAVAPCPIDTNCCPINGSGSSQSNSNHEFAPLDSSFAAPHHCFNGHFSHQAHAMNNNNTFPSGTSTNEISSFFNPNGQIIQSQPFSDAHLCQIDTSFENCYYSAHACCHGCVGCLGTCSQCVEQSHHNSSRGSNKEPFGQVTKYDISTNNPQHSLTQPTMSDVDFSQRSTLSKPSSKLEEASVSSLSALWIMASQAWDGSTPQVSNSDLRSDPLEHAAVVESASQQVSSGAFSYPSPISKPGTSSGKTITSTSSTDDYSGSLRGSSVSADPSSDEDFKEQMHPTSLIQHLTPTPKDTEAFVCKWKTTSTGTGALSMCLDQFESAEALHNHIKTCHVDRLNGYCFCQWEGCDESHSKDFKQRSKLTRHLLVHAGYRPYKCGYEGCEKTFATNQAKDNHERTHAGDKPYRCKHCPYVTTTATQLKTHINAKHIKDKCFHCRLCSFCCADSSNLSKHEKTHRARPYRCLHPGCTFKNDCRWENVKRHFKKSGHCPELLVDDSLEQVRYKAEAAEIARRDPLPKMVSRVRRKGTVDGEGESSG